MTNTKVNYNYMLKMREANKREWTAYARTFRKAVSHARFIFKYGTAQSVCALSLKVPGKVIFYRVAGHPEKNEEVSRVRDIK